MLVQIDGGDDPWLEDRVSRAAAKHAIVAERNCTAETIGDGPDLAAGMATGTAGRRTWEGYVPVLLRCRR